MAEEMCVQLVPLFNHLGLERQRQVERLVHHQHVRRGRSLSARLPAIG
ncbi:MAG: hypothetical protein ACLSH6_05770 [Limosilactobacillus pontis]